MDGMTAKYYQERFQALGVGAEVLSLGKERFSLRITREGKPISMAKVEIAHRHLMEAKRGEL